MLDHVTRRRFSAIVAATIILAVLVSIVGTMRAGTAIPPVFEISGFSMAPTLVGRSEVMHCPHCLYESGFPIERSIVRCRCPQCGSELIATGKIQAANLVKSNDSALQIKRGNFVAITGTNPNQIRQRVVKRVIGIPGDQVDRRGSLLTIDGKLIHDLPWALGQDKPTVAVYRDTGKGISRWKKEGEWLVYHHINPYRGSMPSPVLDDYAVNVNLSRRLNQVTDLTVRSRSAATSFSSSEIVIWKPDDEDSFAAPVNESSPIAIRITRGELDVTELEIQRSVVYRLRPGNDRSRYPMTLGDDEYFVLGDNVPISVDSRDWGPVRHKQILCNVTPIPSNSP